MTTISEDLYLIFRSFSNYSFSERLIPFSGEISEADIRRSDLVSLLIGDDLDLVVPADTNTAAGGSHVDAHGPSSLHLNLDQVGDLIKEILQRTKIINRLSIDYHFLPPVLRRITQQEVSRSLGKRHRFLQCSHQRSDSPTSCEDPQSPPQGLPTEVLKRSGC